MKCVELFAGVGGFRLGIERAVPDAQTVYVSEWDKHAASVYRKHFGEIDTRDITTVRASEIPSHDLICAGFPCQAFSIAGKRRGMEETRGTLFFDICRIARHHRTPYLLLENVKGLLNHDNGATFETILRTLDGLGYDVSWQVLNSKDFGVPQNRERVFIIGHLRDRPRPEVFPLGETDQEYTQRRIMADQLLHKGQSGRVYDKEGLSPTLGTMTGGGNKQPKVYDDYNQQFRKDGLAGTITGNTGSKAERNGQKLVTDRIRRLTPVECERLQGFPDNWTEGVSDTQRYKAMGNAVTVNVVEAVARELCR